MLMAANRIKIRSGFNRCVALGTDATPSDFSLDLVIFKLT